MPPKKSTAEKLSMELKPYERAGGFIVLSRKLTGKGNKIGVTSRLKCGIPSCGIVFSTSGPLRPIAHIMGFRNNGVEARPTPDGG